MWTAPKSPKAIVLAALLLLPASLTSAFEVILDPPEPRPGDVLKVEVIGIDNPKRMRLSAKWGKKKKKRYPFYMVAPGRLRALIGITARVKPGWYQLELTRKRFLLPGETKTIGVTLGDREFTHQYIRMPKKKTALPKKPGAKTALEVIRATLRRCVAHQYWDGVFLRPAKGRRTSAYGHTRTINKHMAWDWHKGIDIAADTGKPVKAPAAGKVVLAARFPVQGGILILDHGQGVMSAFLHLASFEAAVGEEVPKGGVIAKIGGGGFSTGSHLHWGVYIHGDAVDPELLLKREL